MNEKDAGHLLVRLEALATALARLEGKVDALLMGSRHALPEVGERAGVAAGGRLRSMTRRQHGALQMVLRGASNAEIAERFGVTENTAKVYVRGIAAKLGVQTRAQIVAMVLDEFQRMSPAAYAAMAGLPKDWAVTNEGGLTWFPDGRGAD